MFIYTAEAFHDLESCLSHERLSTYLKATDNDKKRALELYVKNTEISAAFYSPLQSLEITLRNSLHNSLSQSFGRNEWYTQIELNQRDIDTIRKAQITVKKLHRSVRPPHVVAELSFGFWLSLLNRRYHQKLWIPSLSKAFPHAHLSRAEILETLDHLRLLRNRIAHHEPVFKRHLKQDHKRILTAIGWICPNTAAWTQSYSMVIEVLNR